VDQTWTRRRHPSATFLQATTLLFGLAVLTVLVLEPHVEGRNTEATLAEIYLHDPFLLFVYVGAIPLFLALFQAFKLIGYIGSGDRAFSASSLRAARLVRIDVSVTIGFVVVGVIILLMVGDERPVALFLGLVPTIALLTIAAAAALVERLIQRGLALQTGHEGRPDY